MTSIKMEASIEESVLHDAIAQVLLESGTVIDGGTGIDGGTPDVQNFSGEDAIDGGRP